MDASAYFDTDKLRALLEGVQNGSVSAEDALVRLRSARLEDDLGFARIDSARAMRRGAAETVFGESKTARQIAGITKRMLDCGAGCVLITRLSPEKAEVLEGSGIKLEYDAAARAAIAGEIPPVTPGGKILIATAGTSDIPVAREAYMTLRSLGAEAEEMYDVGVSGLGRLLSRLDAVMSADVIIVIAGMEGALASVIGGLASCPVIAVPTSVGYGASFGGVTALLSMLNSCSPGVSVVNIDNGFGAAYQAWLVAKAAEK